MVLVRKSLDRCTVPIKVRKVKEKKILLSLFFYVFLSCINKRLTNHKLCGQRRMRRSRFLTDLNLDFDLERVKTFFR